MSSSICGSSTVDQPLGEGPRVVDVDDHALGQAEVAGGDPHRATGRHAEAGDGRPQVGAGVLVGGVGPEGAGDPLARHRLVSHGQEREESL